jgi:hypothetical protein
MVVPSVKMGTGCFSETTLLFTEGHGVTPLLISVWTKGYKLRIRLHKWQGISCPSDRLLAWLTRTLLRGICSHLAISNKRVRVVYKTLRLKPRDCGWGGGGVIKLGDYYSLRSPCILCIYLSFSCKILTTRRLSVVFGNFPHFELGCSDRNLSAVSVWYKGKLRYSPGINIARIAATRFSATFACYDPDLNGLRRLKCTDVKQFTSPPPPTPIFQARYSFYSIWA